MTTAAEPSGRFDEVGPSALQVELDVFSGRPNPRWELTDEEAAALLAQLLELPERPAGVLPSGLGYRGLVVRRPDAGVPAWDELQVGAGMVILRAGAEVQYRADAERAFEWQLLSSGEAHLDPESYAQFVALAFP